MNIICDTREKLSLTFDSYEDVRVIRNGLHTGDYTVEGLEDKLCIERKGSIVEVAQNLTQKRFTKELERMSEFPHSFLVLEFDYKNVSVFPMGTYLAKRGTKIHANFIFSSLSNIALNYGVHVVPCSNRPILERVVYNICKNTVKKYA